MTGCDAAISFRWRRMIRHGIGLLLAAVCVTLSSSCASVRGNADIIAIVDGDPVSRGDLEYSLQISHRREELSSSGDIDLSGFVQKLIDERLIYHEAKRMGLHQHPEVEERVNAFQLREAVTRLYNEEIVRKVKVAEAEITEAFEKALMSRPDAGDAEREKIRAGIELSIRRRKIQERSDSYLAELRQKYPAEMNEELTALLVPDLTAEQREAFQTDDRMLARVGEFPLTVRDFFRLLDRRPLKQEVRDLLISRWVDQRVVDSEALSRHYEHDPEFSTVVLRYRRELTKNVFFNTVLGPQVSISDTDLRDYYTTHRDEFMQPLQYKIQQISVASETEAEDILRDLRSGADFSWLAKTKSGDGLASQSGLLGWRTKEQLPPPLREIVDSLQPGQTSGVFRNGSLFSIIKLQDRSKEEAEDFDTSRKVLMQKVFREKFIVAYNETIKKLREAANIRIDQESVDELKEMLKQKT